jgi:hypothetical protein
LRFGFLRERHLDDAFEVTARGRQHGERVLETLAENFLGGAVPFDHRNFQTFHDGCGGCRIGRTVRPENEIDFVLRHEFLYEAGRCLRIRLIVLVLDVDFVRLAGDLHAAVSVDVVFPELVAFFRQLAFTSRRTRRGERRAENDRVVVGSGRRGNGGRECQRARYGERG